MLGQTIIETGPGKPARPGRASSPGKRFGPGPRISMLAAARWEAEYTTVPDHLARRVQRNCLHSGGVHTRGFRRCAGNRWLGVSCRVVQGWLAALPGSKSTGEAGASSDRCYGGGRQQRPERWACRRWFLTTTCSHPPDNARNCPAPSQPAAFRVGGDHQASRGARANTSRSARHWKDQDPWSVVRQLL